jgi:pimeloyl-ACP methyl ester carboxylesterase
MEASFKRGLEAIRAQRYFEAHEELEQAWRAAAAEERDFFQGLVHVAVAWYQAGRGRPVATGRQLEKAARRLGPFAPTHRDVDVDGLLAQVEAARTRVAAGSLDLDPPRLGAGGIQLSLCGGSIFARSWGAPNGLTVLCWHGAGGSSADYGWIGPELADRLGVRVVAIDAPGHARSAGRAADAFRPRALATLAVEILDELKAARAVFLGFSWGASVGCWFAALNPGRTFALALVEGGHFDFVDLPGFPTRVALAELVSEAEAVATREGAAFGSHTPAVAGAMIYGLCHEPATATYARLAASGTPTLFVGATTPEQSAQVERLARLVPRTTIVQLGRSSHELLRDAPGEVAGAVGDWLADLTGAQV